MSNILFLDLVRVSRMDDNMNSWDELTYGFTVADNTGNYLDDTYTLDEITREMSRFAGTFSQKLVSFIMRNGSSDMQYMIEFAIANNSPVYVTGKCVGNAATLFSDLHMPEGQDGS